MAIRSWIEGFPELTTRYEFKNIWNMDELGLYFKALSEKSHVQKSRSCKGGKKAEQSLTAALFIAADGSKVSEPVVVWKIKSPRCIKNIQSKAKPSIVH